MNPQHGAQAINLHIPRVCIYCHSHIAMTGQLCCGYCLQNAHQPVYERLDEAPARRSLWSRLMQRLRK